MARRRIFRLLPSGVAASPRVAWLSMVATVVATAIVSAIGTDLASADSSIGGKSMAAVIEPGSGS